MKLGSRSYLIAIAVATAVYFLLPTGLQTLSYEAIAVSAGLAMLVGVFRNRPERPEAWLLIAVGVLTFAAGDIAFGDGESVPPAADMLYICAYPLIGLGLSGLSPWRPSRRYSNVVVAAGVASVFAIVCWVFLIVPGDDASQLTSQLIAIGYPVMDVVLIVLLLRAERNGSAEGISRMLGVALTLLLVADIGYATNDFGHDYTSGSIVDAAWLLSYAFFGAALLGIRPPWSAFDLEAIRVDFAPAYPSSGGTAVLEEVVTVRKRLVRPGDVRFGVIVTWSGRMLFALGLSAVVAGVSWLAPAVILLGGAYLFTGAITWAIGSRTVQV
jgi:hypothetical protein